MKLKLAASLLGLALSIPATQLHAQDAAQPAQEQAAPGLPPEILKLLERRDLSQMNPDQLKAYEQQLRRAAAMPGLPPDIKTKLQSQSGAVMAELAGRAAQEPQKQAEQPPAEPPAAMKMKPKAQAQQEQQTGDQNQQAQGEQGQNGQPPVIMKMKPKVQIPQPEAQQQAQAAQPQAEQPAAAPQPPAGGEAPLPPPIQRLLAKHDLAQMNDQDLAKYGQQLQHFARDPSLPPDVRAKLTELAQATQAELAQRQQDAAGQPKANPVPQGQPQQQAQAAQPQANQPAAAPQPPAGGEAPLPPPIQRLLAKRDLAQMNDQDLMQYQQQLQHFAGDPKLPPDTRAKLTALDQAAQTELAQRQQNAAGQPKVNPVPQGQADQSGKTDQQPATPPKQTAETAPAQPPKAPVEKPTTAAPAAPPPAPLAPDAQKVQQLDANPVDPAAEAKAKTYLDDSTDLTKLSDDDLRKRLDDTRELLAANQLSQDTERAVRAKLLKERDVLRLRLAQAEAAKQQQAAANPPPAPGQPQTGQQTGQAQPPAGGKPPAPLPPVSQLPGQPLPPPPPPPPPSAPTGGLNFNVSINFISDATPPLMVLQDRRPPDRLQISELQRRIQVYDDAQGDDQYDPAYRDYWRQSLDYDRELLRRRLMWERRQRAMEIAAQQQQNQLDVDININQPLPPRVPRTVFAAEVDDQDLENVLTAAPPRRYQPQYSVQDIANDQQLRNDLPRVDVDTIHFGYNEGFVREEELSHLDNIATIIERIVAKYPKEVFLIEGHTDAMGSDAYNLKLSKLRADSVMKMMTTYYNIPAANLRTVGLGERFLKIPTADPEPENRRVSVARITPLLAQGQ